MAHVATRQRGRLYGEKIMFNWNVYLAALGLSTSQIVGIGPQNAFIIRQGIGRSHILPIVLICIVADVMLISCGVLGMGKVIGAIPVSCRPLPGLGPVSCCGWVSSLSALRCTRGAQAGWLGGAGQEKGDSHHLAGDPAESLCLAGYRHPDWQRGIGVWQPCCAILHSGKHHRLGQWFVGIGFFASKLAPLFQKSAAGAFWTVPLA
jgi:L-lysine exporter family protein LysE/ArgO